MRKLAALALGLAAIGATGTANAAGLYPPMQAAPAYNAAAFNFNGFYAGAQGGLLTGPYHSGELGVVAGVNFDLSSPVLAGIEFQADWLPGVTTGSTYDFFALGRVGVMVTDALMIYGEGGTGWVAGNGSYAFGGGAEYGLTDVVSVKGEVLGTGTWGTSPGGAKVQAGLLFHLP